MAANSGFENPEETSPEGQNRVLSGARMDMCPKKIKKKNP